MTSPDLLKARHCISYSAVGTRELFLGIDCGTQGTKVVLLDGETKGIVAEGHAPQRLIEDASGTREQDPAWWIDAIGQAIGAALSNPNVRSGDVRAIGVSGQQHGMVPLDGDGHVLRPAKLWCDTATANQADALTARLGGNPAVIQLIGNSIAVGFTASKIVWLKEKEPERYARLRTVLLPHDYINYWLTGERTCEFGDASGTAYFDVRERRWSTRVLQAIDPTGKLSSCLPRFVESRQPAGTLRRAVAEQFGFSPDVVVSSGGGDNMMAAIGTGNVAPGVVTASLGTSGTIYAFSKKPVIDAEGELAAFCSSEGNWLPLACTMNVTVATETVRELLGLDVQVLNAKAAQAPAGSNGILLLPYFNGERTPPLPHARATLHGLTATNLTPENLSRASFEGATFGLRYALDVLRRNGISPAEIRLVGGGARSALWRQIVSNVFECPVVCPVNPEAGALGAAVQAMWCYLGQRGDDVSLKTLTDECVRLDPGSRVEPEKGTAELYSQIYREYLRLNESLKGMNH
jgi:D-xylulose kinase